MGQLVRQQPPSFGRVRRILPVPERDMISNGVRKSVHRPCRRGCSCVRVHPHPAELMSEAGLEKSTRLRIERTSGGAKHIVYDRGRFRLAGVGFVCSAPQATRDRHRLAECALIGAFATQFRAFIRASLALSSGRVTAARAFALKQARYERRTGACTSLKFRERLLHAQRAPLI
jgi:hypothetical protein